MDNNNYEQEFLKKVQQQPAPSPRPVAKTTTSATSLPLILSILLAIVVLVESVALVIFAINYGAVLDLYGETEYDENTTGTNDSPDALNEGAVFSYDENYNITAFEITCTAEDGSKFAFTKSGTYQKTDSSSNSIDSGNYSITNGSAVILKSANNPGDKIVYYDGYDVIEGLSFYTCETE